MASLPSGYSLGKGALVAILTVMLTDATSGGTVVDPDDDGFNRTLPAAAGRRGPFAIIHVRCPAGERLDRRYRQRQAIVARIRRRRKLTGLGHDWAALFHLLAKLVTVIHTVRNFGVGWGAVKSLPAGR